MAQDKEIKTIAEDFANNSKRLSDDIRHVAGNFRELSVKKQYFVKRIQSFNHEDAQRFHADALDAINKLGKVLELEKRYLSIIQKQFNKFKRDADLLEHEGIKIGYVFSSVPGFVQLNKNYFQKLASINSTIEKMLKFIETRIDKEINHVRKSQGGFFTRDFITNFMKEMEKFSQEEIAEQKISGLIEEITKDSNALGAYSQQLMHAWDSIDDTTKHVMTPLAVVGAMAIVTGAAAASTVVAGTAILFGFMCLGKRIVYHVEFTKK